MSELIVAEHRERGTNAMKGFLCDRQYFELSSVIDEQPTETLQNGSNMPVPQAFTFVEVYLQELWISLH